MSKEDVKDFIVDYFCSTGSLACDEKDLMTFAYLDEGIIDSMGIIRMIMAIEEKFDVHLHPEQMQDEEFRTVGGLIDIVYSATQG